MQENESESQREAREFFERHAEGWERRAREESRYSVVVARRERVLELAKGRAWRTALDVGCGSGELTLALAERGLDALGVDFAPEMIARARAVASGQARARFACGSLFEISLPESFDLIVASGFLEYLSRDEGTRFLALARSRVTSDGALVIASRNRLFNLVSLNGYTALEEALGTLPRLLSEARWWTEAPSMAAAVERLHGGTPLLPEPDAHPETGIGVKRRAQYTPAELAGLLAGHGFVLRDLFALHPHAAPPAFQQRHSALHDRMAATLQRHGGDPALVPYCSSYLAIAEPR